MLKSALFVTTFVTGFLAMTPLQAAEEDELSLDPNVPQEQLDQNAVQLPSGQYNRWVCYAKSYFSRRFVGYSHWFAAGSGQGQWAHQIAYDNALHRCRAYNRFGGCYSNFQSDCYVQRANI